MELIDSHCHPEKAFHRDAFEDWLKAASDRDVKRIIATGTGIEDWALYYKLAQKHRDVVYHTVGLHPCDVDAQWQGPVDMLEFWFARDPQPVALGEIGLDYFHLPKDKAKAEEIAVYQKNAFVKQLEFAKTKDCPIVIHSRNAFADCVDIIDQSGVNWEKVVFHCFGNGPEEVKQLNQRGGRASFTGIVTYKNAPNTREAMLAQGLDRLMLETDAPYLTPEPDRGKPNEPAYVRTIAEYCADLFKMPVEELAEVTTRNTVEFFQLNTVAVL